MMQLIRQLFLETARSNFIVTAVHVPGNQNEIADALSRFKLQEFFRLAPTALPSPTAVSQLLLDRLTANLNKAL